MSAACGATDDGYSSLGLKARGPFGVLPLSDRRPGGRGVTGTSARAVGPERFAEAFPLLGGDLLLVDPENPAACVQSDTVVEVRR